MKVVNVTYTVNADYAQQNTANIQQVMADLQVLDNPNIRYTASVLADGQTFVHAAFFNSDADQQVLFALPSFKMFQEQLKASQPEKAPHNEILTLIGSSYNIFN